jgi:hypothetical protein
LKNKRAKRNRIAMFLQVCAFTNMLAPAFWPSVVENHGQKKSEQEVPKHHTMMREAA